jgi:hypothetical protein
MKGKAFHSSSHSHSHSHPRFARNPAKRLPELRREPSGRASKCSVLFRAILQLMVAAITMEQLNEPQGSRQGIHPEVSRFEPRFRSRR